MRKKKFTIIYSFLVLFTFWSFSYKLFSPIEAPKKPSIYINGSNNIDCSDINNNDVQEFSLTVDYTYVKSTEKYKVKSAPYVLEIPFENVVSVSEKVNFNDENQFSPNVISFFPFGFLEFTGDRVVIGENGVISFNVGQAGLLNLRNPSGQLPHDELTRNSIFVAHTDFVFDKNDESSGVFYSIIGAYPARKLVITYLNAGIFDCEKTNKITAQVVLEETTNIIRFYIKEKAKVCSSNLDNKNAIIGIMNNNATKGYTAPGRNYEDGNWTAKEEAWEFKPNGDKGPQISWYEGEYNPESPTIGSEESITVYTAPSNIHYSVLITYPNGVILSDELKINEFIPNVKDIEVIACTNFVDLSSYENEFSLVDTSNFDIKYYLDEGLNSEITEPKNYDYSNDNIVYALVMNKKNHRCSEKAKIEINKKSYPVPKEIYVCDINGDGVEQNFKLSNLDDKILGESNRYTIEYFGSEKSKDNIESITLNRETKIWIEILNGKCRSKRLPINIKFAPVPTVKNLPEHGIKLEICDIQFNYSEPIEKYGTWKDLLLSSGLQLMDPNNEVKVFLNEIDAINDENQITEFVLDKKNKNYNVENNSISSIYFIRIENEFGCFEIIKIPINIRFYGVNTINITRNICKTNSPIDIDLKCFANDMLIEMYDKNGKHITDKNQIFSQIEVTFHKTPKDANNFESKGITPNQILNLTKPTFYYVRFLLCKSCNDSKPCYSIAQLRLNPLNITPEKVNIEVCRTGDGNQTVNNLAIFNEQILKNYGSYIIKYYKNEEDAKNDSNEIKSYEFSGNDILWVRIISRDKTFYSTCIKNYPNKPCEEIFKMNFKFGSSIKPIDFPAQVLNNVCDNDDDLEEPIDLTSFEQKIYNGEATFSYFKTYREANNILANQITDPTSFIIKGDPNIDTSSAQAVVFVKVDYTNNSCFQIVKLNIKLNFKPSIKLNEAYLCECLNSPGTYATFDLTSAIDYMFDNKLNAPIGNEYDKMEVSFYETLKELNTDNKIKNPNDFQSKQQKQTIYVKFKNLLSGCYSTKELHLNNLVQPIPREGTHAYCDLNFNNKPDLLLNELNDIVMPDGTEGLYFNYFYTKEDAEKNINQILGPSFNPYTDTNININYFHEFDSIPEYIYVRVDSDNDKCIESNQSDNPICFGVNRVKMTQGNDITIEPKDYEITLCDTFDDTGLINEPTYNDGIASGFDLTQFEEDIKSSAQQLDSIEEILYYKSFEDILNETYPFGKNAIDKDNLKNFTNVSPDGTPLKKVFVKISSKIAGECPIITEINLNVLKGPTIIPNPNYYLCPGETTDIILNNPDNQDYNLYDINWTLPDGTIIKNKTQLLNVGQVGTYTITIIDKKTGCSSPKYKFNVKEIPPPFIENLIVTNESQIEVKAIGQEGFHIEYSIDGITFQDSNIFSDLSFGIYTLWVRYKENNECLSQPKQTLLLNINNIITPNGDGKNDCVIINNLNVFGKQLTTFQVYDRYGKEIFRKDDNHKIEWCGNYLGRKLNTTDYWYRILLPDGREKKGHITVKNINFKK